MSKLHINQIEKVIIDNFGVYLNTLVVKGDAIQVERNKLSKGLAAYSLIALGVEVKNEVLINSLVDGSDDNGIDLIYYDSSEEILYLVQSKWNAEGGSEPELGDIQKFTTGMHDLLCLRFDKFNKLVNDRKDELETALLKPGVRIKAVLVHTAINQSEHSKRHFHDFCKEHNDINELVQVIIMNQSKLHESLTKNLRDTIDETFYLREWGMKVEPYKAYYGQLTAYEVASLYKQYGKGLFRKNLRNLLGDTEINSELKDTLFTNNELFWYFNNGITIVCDESISPPASSRPFGIFECKNISIVNGAQTVGTLGSILNLDDEDNIENLKSAFIPARIITLKASETYEGIDNLIELITKANNRQNKIENRDFVTLDETQIRLQNELLPEGIHYIVMRGEHDFDKEISFDLEECTRALSYVNSLDATMRFKREKNTVWADVNHPNYKRLFNSGTTGHFIWNAVSIYRMIERVINIKKETVSSDEMSILVNGDDLVAAIVFQVSCKEKISKTEINYDDLISSCNIEQITNIVIDLLIENVKKLDRVPQVLFKNFTDCNLIFEQIVSAINGTRPVEEGSKIELLIERKFNSKKAELLAFNKKISHDEIASTAFYVILDGLDPEKYEISLMSNLHVYKRGSATKAERFLFRLAYHSRIFIYFEFKNYGNEYMSVLTENGEFKQIQAKYGDNAKKIEIVDVAYVEEIISILNKA